MYRNSCQCNMYFEYPLPWDTPRKHTEEYFYTSTPVAGKESALWAIPRNLLELNLCNFCNACWLFNLDLLTWWKPSEYIHLTKSYKNRPANHLPKHVCPTASSPQAQKFEPLLPILPKKNVLKKMGVAKFGS